MSDAPASGLTAFTEYFVRNYPGPDTVIMDPRWHAPRIYRAAVNAHNADLCASGQQVRGNTALANDLMACDVGMINLPFGYGEVRRRIRLAIAALTPAPQPEGQQVRALVDAGQFLIERLASVEGYVLNDDDARDFYGHILPALSRFKAALTPAPQDWGTGGARFIEKRKAPEGGNEQFAKNAHCSTCGGWTQGLVTGRCKCARVSYANRSDGGFDAPEAAQTETVPVAWRIKPLHFDWQPSDRGNPSALVLHTDDYSAYVLIPYEDGYDPGAGIGTWNGVANHKGKSGFPTKEAAMRYCEDTIRRDADRAVKNALRWIDNPAAPAPGIAEALKEARSGLCAYTGGDNGACADTIEKIDIALRALKGGA